MFKFGVVTIFFIIIKFSPMGLYLSKQVNKINIKTGHYFKERKWEARWESSEESDCDCVEQNKQADCEGRGHKERNEESSEKCQHHEAL